MELKYTHILNATDAIMYIHGGIGIDIFGPQFTNEINYLESIGIENVTIRINSYGGNVMEGYSIFSSILNTSINTHCIVDGLAASTAGWLALAGQKVSMTDYSLLMLHNPSNEYDNSPKAVERLQMVKNSLVKIFAKRTGLSAGYISGIMDVETWFNAETALKKGLVMEIIETEVMMTEKADYQTQNANELFAYFTNTLNIKQMENTNTEIKSEETEITQTTETETPVLETVEKTDNAEVIESNTEVLETPAETTEAEQAPEVIDETAQMINDLKAQLEAITKENTELKQKETDRINAEKEQERLSVIENAIKAGKITADGKESWMNLMITDFDSAKTAIEKLPVNKTATKITDIIKTEIINSVSKTFRELEKENPTYLKQLQNENPVEFKRLYDECYSKR